MNDKVINMLWLYPDLLNLHGDRGNIMAFERVAGLLGLKLNVTKVENLTEKIDLTDIDIVFLNPGEIGTILNMISALKPCREELIKYVEEGKFMIAIGTTGALMARKIIMSNGEEHEGLGIIDMECKQRETVIGDDLYFLLNGKQDIIGSQIHMLDFKVNEENILGEVQYGYGNIGDKAEGGKNKNAIFTNALGPVFVKNPWWAEHILKEIARRKEFETRVIALDEYEFEVNSFKSTKKFIANKMQK